MKIIISIFIASFLFSQNIFAACYAKGEFYGEVVKDYMVYVKTNTYIVDSIIIDDVARSMPQEYRRRDVDVIKNNYGEETCIIRTGKKYKFVGREMNTYQFKNIRPDRIKFKCICY